MLSQYGVLRLRTLKISPTPGCPCSSGSLQGPEVRMSTGQPNSACSTRINAVNSTMSPKAPKRTASGRSTSCAIAHDAAAESFHFFQLRTELQQQQIDSCLLKPADLLPHLRRRAHQP